MKQILKVILQITIPFLIAIGILWWMYRGTDWSNFFHSLWSATSWSWMALSLALGILPQLARAWRWKLALEPLGQHPRRTTCVDAIFLSYAASLVIPRIGEVMRCGTLKRVDGVPFSQSLGTVVTERVVDSLLIVLLTLLALMSQLPMFLTFLRSTGTHPVELLQRFTATGYLVTFLCLLLAIIAAIVLLRRLHTTSSKFYDLLQGIRSLRRVRNVPLYIFFSLLIWVGYFLHFYVAFYCFPFTYGFPLAKAFLIFCVGTFAVLVPTPNGAGPWHFAVKTMLVLYGVVESQAILFALIVHTVQTALVIVLGAFAWARLSRTSNIQPLVSSNQK